jgi:hypothetical protein
VAIQLDGFGAARLAMTMSAPRPAAKKVAALLRAGPAAAVQSKPQLLAWITCDGVHIDPGSGKHTILGIFSNIQARQFPVTHPFMVWFLTITDCAPGEHKMRISIGRDPTRMQPLLERPFATEGPLQRINLINEIRNLSFPVPGEYSLLIEVDDETLLVTSLTISGP